MTAFAAPISAPVFPSLAPTAISGSAAAAAATAKAAAAATKAAAVGAAAAGTAAIGAAAVTAVPVVAIAALGAIAILSAYQLAGGDISPVTDAINQALGFPKPNSTKALPTPSTLPGSAAENFLGAGIQTMPGTAQIIRARLESNRTGVDPTFGNSFNDFSSAEQASFSPFPVVWSWRVVTVGDVIQVEVSHNGGLPFTPLVGLGASGPQADGYSTRSTRLVFVRTFAGPTIPDQGLDFVGSPATTVEVPQQSAKPAVPVFPIPPPAVDRPNVRPEIVPFTRPKPDPPPDKPKPAPLLPPLPGPDRDRENDPNRSPGINPLPQPGELIPRPQPPGPLQQPDRGTDPDTNRSPLIPPIPGTGTGTGTGTQNDRDQRPDRLSPPILIPFPIPQEQEQRAPIQTPPANGVCPAPPEPPEFQCNFSDCASVTLCEPERQWLERAGGIVYSGGATFPSCEKLFPDQPPLQTAWEDAGPNAILQAIEAQNQAIDRVLQWICKLADQEPSLAVPEWWPIVRGNQIRQMVIAYRTRLPDGRLGDADRQITIPHYAGTGAPIAPTYTSGPYYAIATLSDNSKVHVYGNTEDEARRVCQVILNQVQFTFRINSVIRSGQITGRQVQVRQRVPYSWQLWPNGQEGGQAADSGYF